MILHKDISDENQKRIISLQEENQGVSIRFIDMSEYDNQVQTNVGAYFSVETNYRLFLFSELFEQYDRMLYLDCDIIVMGDVGELYDTELEDKLVGAVESVEFRMLSISKKAMFIDLTPYNADNYRREGLGMKEPEKYFNAGVLVLDLKRTREVFGTDQAVKILHSHDYQYNDQDVLNILYDTRVKLLDVKWNYMANIERGIETGNENCIRCYNDLVRTDFRIIHYVSGRKPWNSKIPLGDYYWKYLNMIKEKKDE